MDDINNVDLIETFEELKDRDQHFKLYYSRDMEGMQEYTKKQKREAKEAKRRLRNERRRITKMVENEETGEQEEVTDEEAMADQENELDEEEFEDELINYGKDEFMLFILLVEIKEMFL